MKRLMPAAFLILVLATGLGGCGGYISPSRGIDDDIAASRGSGSAALVTPLNFR